MRKAVPVRQRTAVTALVGALPILLLGAIQVVRSYIPQPELSQTLAYGATTLFAVGALVGLMRRMPIWAYSWFAFTIAALPTLPAPLLRQFPDSAESYGAMNAGLYLLSLALTGAAAFVLSGRGRTHGFLLVGSYITYSALTYAVASSALELTPALPWVLLYILVCGVTAWVAYRAVIAIEASEKMDAGPAVLRVLVVAVAASVFVGSFPVNYFGVNPAVMLGSIMRPIGLLITAGILIAVVSFRGKRYPAGASTVPAD